MVYAALGCKPSFFKGIDARTKILAGHGFTNNENKDTLISYNFIYI